MLVASEANRPSTRAPWDRAAPRRNLPIERRSREAGSGRGASAALLQATPNRCDPPGTVQNLRRPSAVPCKKNPATGPPLYWSSAAGRASGPGTQTGMSCDRNTHTPAKQSSTNFIQYPVALQNCPTSCLGHGHGYGMDIAAEESVSGEASRPSLPRIAEGPASPCGGSDTASAPSAPFATQVHGQCAGRVGAPAPPGALGPGGERAGRGPGSRLGARSVGCSVRSPRGTACQARRTPGSWPVSPLPVLKLHARSSAPAVPLNKGHPKSDGPPDPDRLPLPSPKPPDPARLPVPKVLPAAQAQARCA